jgi:FKBP-type peptidyl-prolyl cis-trans isomerase (trigger factor)
MTFDDFLDQYMQMTRDEIHEMDSLYIKQDLVLYSLVRELGIELTDEEYNAGVQAYASSYGVDVQTFLDEYGYTELDLRSSLFYQKTMDEIYSRIVIVED